MEVFVSKGTDTNLRNNLIRILEDGVSCTIAVTESYEESDRVLGYKYSVSDFVGEGFLEHCLNFCVADGAAFSMASR